MATLLPKLTQVLLLSVVLCFYGCDDSAAEQEDAAPIDVVEDIPAGDVVADDGTHLDGDVDHDVEVPDVEVPDVEVPDVELPDQELTELVEVDVADAQNCVVISGDLQIQEAADLVPYDGLCFEVHGSLFIYGAGDVVSLEPLAGLTLVTDKISILDGHALESIHLPALELAGSIDISHAPALLTVTLEALTSTERISIDHSPVLERLALPQLLEVTERDVNVSINHFDGRFEVRVSSLVELQAPALERVEGSISIVNTLLTEPHFPSLTHVGKALFVSAGPNSRLASLAGFSALTMVDGPFILVAGESLTSLAGMESLRRIGGLSLHAFDGTDLSEISNVQIDGGIVIEGNRDLQSLRGLEGSRTQFIEIHGNDSLTSLEGLSSLISQDEVSIRINANASLTNTNGISFAQPTAVALEILENPALQTISGFEGAAELQAHIFYNDALTTIGGFQDLAIIKLMRVFENPAWTGFDSLPELTRINTLLLYDSPSLTSLAGLEAVEVIGPEVLTNNPALLLQNNDSLLSLQGLTGILKIEGPVVIADNDSLTSLSGLESLQEIDDDFEVINNPGLTTLGTFPNLISWSVGHDILVSGSPLFSSLGDFPAIERLGYLELNGTLVTDLIGLVTLERISGLRLVNNPNLTSLNGLQNVIESYSFLCCDNGSFVFRDNPALTSLAALSNFNGGTGGLFVENNDALTTLSGLEGFRTANYGVTIENNATLSDMTALMGLEEILSGNAYRVFNNPNLPRCQAQAVHQDLRHVSGAVTISGNDMNATCP